MSEQDVDAPNPIPQESAAADAPGLDRGLLIVAAFLVVVAGFLLYGGARAVPLYSDAAGILFAADGGTVDYREATAQAPWMPLGVATLRVQAGLGLDAAAVVTSLNLLLHLAASVLLLLCARRLFGAELAVGYLVAGGLALAIHPIASESVLTTQGRGPVLAGLLSLAGLYAVLGALRAEAAGPRATGLLLAFIAFATAYAADYAAVVAPLVALLAVGAKRDQPGARDAAGVCGVAAAALLVHFVAAQPLGEAGTVHGWAGVVAAQAHAAAHHLGAWFWPAALLPVSPPLASEGGVLGAALLAGALGGAVLLAVLRQPMAVGLGGVALVLLVLPCLLPADEVLRLRHAYLVAVWPPLLLLGVFALLRPAPVQLAAGALAGVLLLPLAYVTFQRTVTWAEPPALWAEAAGAMPAAARPHRELARLAEQAAQTAPDTDTRQQQLLQAAQHWEDTLARLPSNAEALLGAGRSWYRLGELPAARAYLEDALRRRPTARDAQVLLGALHAQTDSAEAARRAADYFAAAAQQGELPLDVQPLYAGALLRLGEAEQALAPVVAGEGEEAQVPPQIMQLRASVAGVQEARRRAQQQLQEDPTSTAALLLQAEASVASNRPLQAYYLVAGLLRREPDNADAWQLMGVLRAVLGNPQGFIAEYGARGDAGAWRRLLQRVAGAGRWDAAETYAGPYLTAAASDTPAVLLLAELAGEVGNVSRQQSYLQQATEDLPESPEPWLQLAELALDAEQRQAARSHLAAAAERGATEEQVQPLRDRLDALTPRQPARTIIQ